MRSVFLLLPLLLPVACSLAATDARPTFEPDAAAHADAASIDESEKASDASADAVRSRVDGGTVDADATSPPTDDPQCATATGTVTFGAIIPRSEAEPMPFGYRTLINGERPSGNVVGDEGQQWFSFSVEAPHDLALAFIGSSRTSANFYFESETTPRAALGGPVPTGTLHVDPGTYYVQITDGISKAQGASWNVTMRWVVAPAACADAGP